MSPEPDPPTRSTTEPITGVKRVQLVLHPGPPVALRFAGPVETGSPYRVDDVFGCRRGHRRIEPGCTCGFYAVEDGSLLKPSVTRTVVVTVELEGRVIRHRGCYRAERQLIRSLTMDGWCAFCVRPAVALAAVPVLFDELPQPWQRTVPVCELDAANFATVLDPDRVAAELEGVEITWDRSQESPAAASLRRLLRARKGAAL